MARPKKNNADYFSHDKGMRDDPKIKALRRKYSHKGYAIYCFLLEVLTDAENTAIDFEGINIEILAGDFDIETDELQEIVAYMVAINLFQMENCKLSNLQLKLRLEYVFCKRNAAKERFLSQKLKKQEVSVTESTQSKVKESKVNIINNNSDSEQPKNGHDYEAKLPELQTLVFYNIHSMTKHPNWTYAREHISRQTGKLPSQDAEYLKAALNDYSLVLQEKGEWNKGMSIDRFAGGLIRRIKNGWTPLDKK